MIKKFSKLIKNKSQSFQKEKKKTSRQHTKQIFRDECYIVSTFSSGGKIIISPEYTSLLQRASSHLQIVHQYLNILSGYILKELLILFNWDTLVSFPRSCSWLEVIENSSADCLILVTKKSVAFFAFCFIFVFLYFRLSIFTLLK